MVSLSPAGEGRAVPPDCLWWIASFCGVVEQLRLLRVNRAVCGTVAPLLEGLTQKAYDEAVRRCARAWTDAWWWDEVCPLCRFMGRLAKRHRNSWMRRRRDPDERSIF